MPENIAKREDLAVSELKAATERELKGDEPRGVREDLKALTRQPTEEEKADDLSATKKSSGATKLSEDIFDDVYESKTTESKLAKEGAANRDKVGDVDLDPSAATEKKVTDVNSKLSEVTVAKLKEDEEKLGGVAGVRQKSEEVVQGLKEHAKKIEDAAKGMPQDMVTGTIKRVDESSPYFEQQKQVDSAIKERNAYLASECQNTAVCTTVSDMGETRTISPEDLSHKRNASLASAMRGNQYVVKDGSDDALVKLNRSDAVDVIAQNRDARIAAIEADAAKQRSNAEGVAALRDHEATMDQKTYERGISPIPGGEQAVRVESQKVITDNSVAAGIVNSVTTDQKTKDELGSAFQGLENKREAMEILQWAPTGGAFKAADSYANYSRIEAQQNLLPESAEAEKATGQAWTEFKNDTKMAAANLGVTAATGGIGGTITGGALGRAGALGFAESTATKELAQSAGKLSTHYAAQEAAAVSRAIPEAPYYRASMDLPPAHAAEMAAQREVVSAERTVASEIAHESPAMRQVADDAGGVASNHVETPSVHGEPVHRPVEAYWDDTAVMDLKKDKVLKAYSEEDALAKFSPQEKNTILQQRERIASQEASLESIINKAADSPSYHPSEPLPKKASKEILTFSKKHAEEIEKLMQATGREGGEIVKLPKTVTANDIFIPERYVYQMTAKSEKSALPTGLKQHDIFLKQMPDYAIQFDPVRNSLQGTNGVEMSSQQVLSLKSVKVDFSKRGQDMVLMHEGVHGRQFNSINEGKPSLYDGTFHSDRESVYPVGPGGYAGDTSLQEMVTYRMEAKETLTAAREAAILRNTNAEIPDALMAKLDSQGVKLEDIGRTGNIEKDFPALTQYREHARMYQAHLTALEDSVRTEGRGIYSVRVGEHGEDISVIPLMNEAKEEIGNAKILIPGKDEYFIKAPNGTFVRDDNIMHLKVTEQISDMRKNAQFHLDEAMQMTKEASPKIAEYAESHPFKSMFARSHQEIEEVATKSTGKASEKLIDRMDKANYDRRANAVLDSPAPSKASMAKSLRPPPRIGGVSSYPTQITSGLKQLAKNIDTIYREAIPRAVENVKQSVVNAMPAPLREFAGIPAPATKAPEMPVAVAAPSPQPSPANPAIPPAPGAPVASTVPGTPGSAAPGTPGSPAVAGKPSAPTLANDIVSGIGKPNLAGANGSSPNGMVSNYTMPGGRFPASAGDAGSSDVSVSGSHAHSDVSGTPAGQAAFGGVASSGGVSGQLASGKAGALAVSSGSSRVGALGLAFPGGLPASAAEAAAANAKSGAKQPLAKSASLKEKLLQQLAESDRANAMGSSSGGVLTAFSSKGSSSGNKIEFYADANAAEADVPAAGAQGAAAYLADPDGSLFLRIRRMHIKYLERKYAR